MTSSAGRDEVDMAYCNTGEGFAPQWATHPGEHLLEYLEINGWSQAQFGRVAGLTPKLVNQIISKKNPVTPATALKLERVLGLKASIWLSIQSRWDLHQLRSQSDESAPETKSWLKLFPLKELKERKILPNVTIRQEKLLLDALLKFLGIGEPSAFDALVANFDVQHRQSIAFNTSYYHIACWLRLGEQRAGVLDLPPYDAEKFLEAVCQIRNLTTSSPQNFEPVMKKLCCEAGVALILEPAISKTAIFGSTHWLDGNNPVIQMSLRLKTNDHFWWTFFHEAAHVLLHQGQTFIDEKKPNMNDFEKEADAWALEQLVGKHGYDVFKSRLPRSEAAIKEFAKNNNIHPGIVVGMLQHDRIVSFKNLNRLKARFEWSKS